MTMIIHTAIPAPILPQIRIKFGFFTKIVKIIIQAHRHSRDAQNFLRAHDAILNDVGLTRVKVSGNTYLFSHRN